MGRQLYIYKYSGNGLALGATATVLAYNFESACKIIEGLLEEVSLEFNDEWVTLEGKLILVPQILDFWYGDY